MSDKNAWLRAIFSKRGPPHPTTRLVLYVISMHIWKGEEKSFPGQERLGELSGLTSRAVRDHIKVAEALGWLRIVPIAGVRNEYYPAIPGTVPRTFNGRDTPENSSGVIRASTPEKRSGVSKSHPGTTFRGKDANHPGNLRRRPRKSSSPTPEQISADSTLDTSTDTTQKDLPPTVSVLVTNHFKLGRREPGSVFKIGLNGKPKAEETASMPPEQARTIEPKETRLSKAATLMRATPDITNSSVAKMYDLAESEVRALRSIATPTATP